MSKQDRNQKVQDYITSKLDQAASQSVEDFFEIENFDNVERMLNDLIFVEKKGFRGIVATAIAGQLIDPNYDPLNDFYRCNPRSIYEQGIYYAFSGRIPCGKSDPLNVAKNVSILDAGWVQGKRPMSAAQAVVDFLTLLENRENEREILINFYFYKLIEYANSVEAIELEVPNSDNLSKLELAEKLVQFTLNYPESGTIPQMVVALLLEATFSGSNSVVEGANESVFGTNTTSKKPADIWVEQNGKVLSLFEITVKKVDEKRLDDAIEHIIGLDLSDKPLTFICRLPEDVNSLGLDCGQHATCTTHKHKGKVIDFVDIDCFIKCLCSIISDEAMQTAIDKLASFVDDIDRPVSTKNGWNYLF